MHNQISIYVCIKFETCRLSADKKTMIGFISPFQAFHIDCIFYDTNMSNLPNYIQCLKFDNCAFNRTTNIITNLMQNIPENVKHLTITVDLNYFDLNYYNIPSYLNI